MDRMESIGAHYVTGTVRYRILDQSVSAEYHATNSGPRGWPVLATSTVNERVAYHPTCAAFIDDDLIAVGGKRSGTSGHETVIELWEMAVPTVVLSLDPASGKSKPNLVGARVLRKTIVHDSAAPGRDMVCSLVRLRGKPSSLFVQFWDSRDVYELDYGELLSPTSPPPQVMYPITQRLSATPSSSVLHVPELADKRRTWIRGATHKTHGYVYVLYPSFDTQASLYSSGGLDGLTLFDRDRDGAIEDWVVQGLAENTADGLTDQVQFEEIGLCLDWD